MKADALEVDYRTLVDGYDFERVINFVSLDLEPPSLTCQVLEMFPFDVCKPDVWAIESDAYRPGGRERSIFIQTFMERQGYLLTARLYPLIPQLKDPQQHGEQDLIFLKVES
jgi:hypothetical protein